MPRHSSWPGGSSGQYNCPTHSSFLLQLKGLWREIFAFARSSQIEIVIGCQGKRNSNLRIRYPEQYGMVAHHVDLVLTCIAQHLDGFLGLWNISTNSMN
jgi:hypothetical protein